MIHCWRFYDSYTGNLKFAIVLEELYLVFSYLTILRVILQRSQYANPCRPISFIGVGNVWSGICSRLVDGLCARFVRYVLYRTWSVESNTFFVGCLRSSNASPSELNNELKLGGPVLIVERCLLKCQLCQMPEMLER
jgi:hypothetical protein